MNWLAQCSGENMDVLQSLILFTWSLLYLADLYVQMVVCALLRLALTKFSIVLMFHPLLPLYSIFLFFFPALQSWGESLRTFFKIVSDLRGKERSLLYGDYLLLYNTTNALAYLRSWDQSERYLVAFNWSPDTQVTLQLSHEMLPEKAMVVVSTNEKLASDQLVDLAKVELEPAQAVMLKFPYVA